MSLYSLDDEDSKSVEAIFENLPKLKVVDEYKKALQSMTDKVCDELTDYMRDEYILRFNEIIERQARKVVEELLRGENLASFGLQLREAWNRPGEFHSYDGEKVRAALVRDFKDEIMTAEMHSLKEDNERMRKDLESFRSRY